MTGWIIRLILLFFIIRAVMRLVRGIAEGMRAPRVEQPAAVPLARDPVCGTFVVPSQAVTAGTGADMRFFCSEKCRRAYDTPSWQASAEGKPPQAAASAQRDGERKRGPIERSDR